MNDIWNRRYRLEGELWGDSASPTATALHDALLTPSTILEVGCGYGRDLRYLHGLGHEVAGVEVSEAGIDLALRLNQKKGVNFKIWDSTQSVPQGGFDAVFFHRVIHLLDVSQIETLINFSATVLRPNGLLFASARDSRDFDVSDMIWIGKDSAEYKEPSRRGHIIHFWTRERFEAHFLDKFVVESFQECSEIESLRNSSKLAHLLLMRSHKKELPFGTA